jgi:glycosyltransferase involved in cell wall biosynthesis
MKRPLRVCIDARLEPGRLGGVEQVVIGLARGLSELDGDEEYAFLVGGSSVDWLTPHLGGQTRLLHKDPWPQRGAGHVFRRARRLPGRLSRVVSARERTSASVLPLSSGTVERYGADVIHFPIQYGFRTKVPSVYYPSDLQHRHRPEFFAPEERTFRDAVYGAMCRQARLVTAATEWGRRDLIAELALSPQKVAAISLAPVATAYPKPTSDDLARVRREYQLPEAFAFYPAQTWPHKNHLGLFEALALLTRRGIPIPLVCSGRRNDFHPELERRVAALGLDDAVRFLDYVPELELRSLYELATLLVFPSLFEGWGLPILEAFASELPVVCSDIPPLREQTAGAALTFDPEQPESIAATLERAWVDAALREKLRRRGRECARAYSWDRTARVYRAHYRRIAGRPLAEEDRSLVFSSLSGNQTTGKGTA